MATDDILLDATTRASISEAISWLADDHPVRAGSNWSLLLQRVVELFDDFGKSDEYGRALRRVTREATASNIDSSKILFCADQIPTADQYSRAIDLLVERTRGGRLTDLTAQSVLSAYREDPTALDALCLMAGVPRSDAEDWFGVTSGWSLAQITDLLDYLTDLVSGKLPPPIENTERARAIEFVENAHGGWKLAEELRTEGVSYSLLLAQREVGGVWLQHKNRTSSALGQASASLLCDKLDASGIQYRRSTTVGGITKGSDIKKLSGIDDKRIGLVVLGRDLKPVLCVTFSAAKDGGTARANGDGLLQIPTSDLPVAAVLTGLGWAPRPETDRLSTHFHGLLFSELSIDRLVSTIVEVIAK